MHGATCGNCQELLSLGCIQITIQMNLTADLVKHPIFRFTVLAVFSMYSAVAQPHLDSPKCDTFLLRIHAECHRCSRTKSNKQELIGTRTPVRTANRLWLVGKEAVLARFNHLGKPFFDFGTHDHT